MHNIDLNKQYKSSVDKSQKYNKHKQVRVIYNIMNQKYKRNAIEFIRFIFFKCIVELQQFRTQKNVLNYDEPMNQEHFFCQDIFMESSQPIDSQTQDDGFLDEFFRQESSPNQTKSNYDIPVIDNYQDSSNGQLQSKISKRKKIEKESKNLKKPESSYTKNVCYNICQKTIKVIKEGDYQDKLMEICQLFNFDPIDFEIAISKKKNQFTGPKALKYFIEQPKPQSKIFAKFMKWFLQQKYLRYAINKGEMNNIKSYISYKNEVMLSLLQ